MSKQPPRAMTEQEKGERVAQITAILGELSGVWLEHPDWTLGQLIGNVLDAQDTDPDLVALASPTIGLIPDRAMATGLLALRTERYVLTDEQLGRARREAMKRLGITSDERKP